jgi:hypothetical protein
MQLKNITIETVRQYAIDARCKAPNWYKDEDPDMAGYDELYVGLANSSPDDYLKPVHGIRCKQ